MMGVHLKAILAVDARGGVGKGNVLPWHDKSDLAHFKRCTLNQTIMMGWNTFISFNGKPLPNRHHVVIYNPDKMDNESKKMMIENTVSHEVDYITESEFEDLLALLNYPDKYGNEVWLVGGAKMFNKYLTYCDAILVSCTDEVFDCDTFVDLSILDEQFTLVETTPLDDSIFTVYKYLKKA